MAHHLSIDIETYSSVPIAKAGAYKYAQSPDFEILLLAYSYDGGPVYVVDLTKDSLPGQLQECLFDENITKHAWNAAFEWWCLSQYFGLPGPSGPGFTRNDWLVQWRCDMVHSMYCGYPASLDAAGKALGLPEDKQKLSVGKALIRYFCIPCKPSKSNGGRTRNLPRHDPDKWELFKSYCQQDVATEMENAKRLDAFPVPDWLWDQWRTDLVINSRGVFVDLEMVRGAIALDKEVKAEYIAKAQEITRLDNPNSVQQLTKWLEAETGDTVTDLRKDTVGQMLTKGLNSDKAAQVLQIRQQLSKTSTKKYYGIADAVCDDGRLRGLLQFYGASRTGRWSGRGVQPQNLPRTYLDALPVAKDLIKQRNRAGLEMLYGDLPDTLSQMIRTALTATPGNRLIDADFSAIEARVVAWLAGEEWVLDVFRTHGKIYEATASMLYGIPLDRIKKGNPEYSYRQNGKAATLALGYGGGAPALIRVGRLPEDTAESELEDIKRRWRQTNPNIVRFWYAVEAAALEACRTGRPQIVRGLILAREFDPATGMDALTIRLHSGRKLYYVKPHPAKNRFGSDSLGYWGVNQTNKRWERQETYGGKLVENITQATARDCLAEAIERLEAAGYPVVFHVHDEVIIDCSHGSLEEVIAIMSQPPAWAPDLPLTADGWECDYFKKD